MTSAAKTITISMADWPRSLLRSIRARAAEENVTLEQYLSAMFWHALKGHDLSKIHFYQDGSGDTYDLDEVARTHEQAMADDRAGELKTFETAEEGLAYLRKIRENAEAGREFANV